MNTLKTVLIKKKQITDIPKYFVCIKIILSYLMYNITHCYM